MSEHDRLAELTQLGKRLIAEEMKKPDVLGGALHGSLAMGRNWPTSDLDYCTFPLSSAPPSGRVPAYRRYNDRGMLLKYNHYAELRIVDGIYVNLTIKTKASLDDMMARYPQSFIESAEGIPGEMQSTFFLDGLAIMSIVEDPSGYLATVKEFVARHRFSPDVLPERLKLMLASARRKLEESRRALAEGRVDLAPRYDFARCIAQMWLEVHGRVYSRKEQDTLLAEAAGEAKAPEVHDLYRATLGLDVEKDALFGMLGPIASYASELDGMLGVLENLAAQRVEEFGADFLEDCQAARLSTALSFQSVRVAFDKGCYAHIAFVLQKFGPAALGEFMGVLGRLAPPSQLGVFEEACRAGLDRSRAVWDFFGHIEGPHAREPRRLEAASQLLALTERRLMAR